ncbi:rhomboid family intramembrane serine protease [uncultured Duncaniella sp.]|uniref:rhomboid family intramembrane serine protease n=1 Tax=uncultured Duncaniella sp. TaxID=2768039 RepID=UPI0026F3D82D|nr:rhomboid family intramembrane serine protease [uncultured Duncaniella sp.]
MVRQKEAKNAALLTAVVIILMSFTYVPDWSAVGVAVGCPSAARLVYSFFHASPLHAAVNAWCLICVVFLYDVSIWRLLTAYIVAVVVPGFLLSDVPTVGLSCVCYFLLGSLIFEVKRKLYFMSCMALYIAVGFLFPSVNAVIHVYGYLAGLLVGLLNAPLSCLRIRK